MRDGNRSVKMLKHRPKIFIQTFFFSTFRVARDQREIVETQASLVCE